MKKTGRGLLKFVNKYGEEEGLKRYNNWLEHSKNPKQNFINKYGEEEGLKRYKEYEEKRRYARTKEGIIEKYGEEKGKEILKNFDNNSLKSFIKRYGEEIGKKKYEEHCNKQKTKSKRSIEYWLIQTNGNKEEAKKLHKESQAKFSLKKCIEKHGEEKGKEIWQERQTKWQNTLNSKDPEEIKEINKNKGLNLKNFIKKYGEIEGIEKYNIWLENVKEERKNRKLLTLNDYIKKYGKENGEKYYYKKIYNNTKFTASKKSLSIFFPLMDWILENTNICFNDINLGIPNNSELRIKNRYYDFSIKKLKIIIEFNGIKYHIKKKDIYNKNVILYTQLTKNEMFLYEKEKRKLAITNKYRILTIWENDKNALQRCIKFISYWIKNEKNKNKNR